MNINILLVILTVLAVWRICRGAKRGITGEVYHLMSLVISLFVLALGILLYTSIKEKDSLNIVLSVAVMLITGLVSKLVSLVMKSLKTIAHLPIISFCDKILGMAAGAAEAIVVLWILYIIVGRFDTGTVGEMIIEWTQASPLLQKLYDLNYVALFVKGAG